MTTYFDSDLGEKLANEGIERSDSGATEEWREMANLAFVLAAIKNYDFTSDAVWAILEDDWKVKSPKERKAMGARARYAVSAGTIEMTEEHRPSKRPDAHRNPKTVYRSLLYDGPAPEQKPYKERAEAVIDEARLLVDMIHPGDAGYDETYILRKTIEALDYTT